MKSMLPRMLTVALCLGACLASQAFGQVLTSLSLSAPPDERSLVRIAVPDDDLGTSYMMRYYNNYTSATNRRREIGQAFVVPGSEPVEIEGFALRIRDNRDLSSVATGFTLSIFQAAEDGVPTGPALYQATGNLPTGLADLAYITFTLEDAFSATAGERYSFQIGYTSSSGASQLSFAASDSNIYPEGRSFYYANSSSSDLPAMIYTPAQRDLDFTVLYTPVPEASTIGLFLGSLLTLAVFSKRRRREPTPRPVSPMPPTP